MRRGIASRVAVDARALAAFRAGLGAVLVLDLCLRARDLAAFYTDAGAVPRTVLADHYPLASSLSIHALSGGLWWQVVLFAVAGLAALALLVGYRTRTAAVVSFISMVSLVTRNPFVMNGGDSILLNLLFWSLFLPLGERWSVDARLGDTGRRDRIGSPATAALLVQVVVVYGVNAVLKLRGSAWLDGVAVRTVFSLDRFTVFLGDVVADVDVLLTVVNYAWLGLVLSSPLLLLLRGRTRGVLAGLFGAAHLGMALTMDLGVFPLVSTVALLPFLPASVWDRLYRHGRVADRALGRIARGLTAADRHVPSLDVFPSSRRLSLARQRVGPVVVSLLLVGMLGYNAATLGFLPLPEETPGELDVADPRWNMFSTHPRNVDSWYVAPANTTDGAVVDALWNRSPGLDRPPDATTRFPDSRWRNYLDSVRGSRDPALARELLGYRCARWNQTHRRNLTVAGLDHLRQPTNLTGPEPVDRERLAQYRCGAITDR